MTHEDPASRQIRRRAERMQQQRSRRQESPLRGFSAFGAIGWSIALPTVAGALLGLWLDRIAPQRFAWPLALMLAGLVVGILVAVEWVGRENRRNQAAPQFPQPPEDPDV